MAHNELEVAAGAGPLACSSAGLWGHRATSRDCSKKQSCKNLRIRINRLRRKGEDTEDLLLELHDKEKIYGRGKQQRPPGAYLATNQIFSTE